MDISSRSYPTMLTIAGSDSIGGAGIQADIKTATALGVYAMSVVTAVTAQNTLGVDDFVAIAPQMVDKQLQSVVADVVPDVVKLGMIPNAAVASAIAHAIRSYNLANVVVDPVMVATSGDKLTADDTVLILKNDIIPTACLVTPNIPEARVLTSLDIRNVDDMERAGSYIVKNYNADAVLVKGGHMALTSDNDIVDVLVTRTEVHAFKHPFIDTPNTHGTGCSLSSAIASFLALGYDLPSAVHKAILWLDCAINHGADYTFGHGHGPINHMYKIAKNS